MPIQLSFTLDKVYLRAGVVSHTFTAAGQLRPARPYDKLGRFGVFLFWPKALGWLKLAAHAAPDPGVSGNQIAFSDTVSGLDAACAEHSVRRDQVAPAKFLETYTFLVASLPRDNYNRVFLTVSVDTDDEGFRSAVKERRMPDRGEMVQPIQLMLFDAKQFKAFVSQSGQIDLVLKPCVPVPRFPGVLAIDLGNTTTTAASQSEDDPVHKSESVRLIPLESSGEPVPTADPMPSVIRFDRVNTAGELPDGTRRFPAIPSDDRPTAVVFAAGRAVIAGTAEGELPPGVVYGAKQLLSVKDPQGLPPGPDGKPPEGYMTLTIPHARPAAPPQPEAVEVLNRVPGELLFTHAIRRFRQGNSAWPPDLALTYPTTYSPRELRQVVRAAARGWLRAMSQPQAFDPSAEPNEDEQLESLGVAVREWLSSADTISPTDCPLIGLTLDEATAAAFFHIYRRVFEQRGGLVRFRYEHPEGLRLLLIDCGGGTTDVALVHAVSPPESPRLLVIDVLARTGVRAFGGDHITREVCRLLKAKMALILAKAKNPAAVPATIQPPPTTGPAVPENARTMVDGFITRVRELDPRDDLVPTRFDPHKPDPATHERRTTAHALWQLGEELKRRLGEGKPVKLKDLSPDKKLGKGTSPLIAAVLQSMRPEAHAAVLTQLGDLSVNPWEVDALIRKPVESTMNKCNRLIRKHLIDSPADGREHEIDWVVLSGNGGRYPLVQKLARELLHVASIEDRLSADPGNLKEAVAKGAAMARMVERVPRAAGIKFNRHLSELLPFDLGFHNMITSATDLLFAEYTPYTELAKEVRKVRLVPPAGGHAALGNTFILERRFPGDDSYSQYAAYTFTQGIQGELEVRYDPVAGEFAVTETTTREEGVFKDLTESEHHAAAMRGDI